MNNANLHEALKEYCKVATTLFKERINKADLPLKDETRITDLGGAHLTQTVMKVDWQSFMITIDKRLWELDAYQRALQAMTDDQTIAKHLNTLVGHPGARRRIEGPECLRWFVAQLLEEQQDFDFQESAFQKIYENFEDFFCRNTFEYRAVCPLHNFKMQAEQVELSPKFSIIKFSTKDKERIFTNYGHLGSLGQLTLHDEFALEIYVEAPKVIGEIPGDPAENDPLGVAKREFDDVCDALRLFKKGAAHYGEYWMEPTSWNVIGTQSAWPGWGAPGRLYGDAYSLSNDEVPIFLEFLKSPRKDLIERRKSIMLAFNRLKFGYERLRSEDRLIDFMIGLEALFLGEGEKDELSYRLSLRAAALLGDTPVNREKIFNELHKAYGVRSTIAHGKELKKGINIDGNQISFAELVNRVEEHLRSAIKEFLVRCENQSESQVRKMLDQNIARGFPTTS
jgi:hypothetical protein